ncbi:dihydrolipoyl dehydrogenase [Faecousia sp.]|jgi:dihydrolipoamide dehydrogenase|uniref:dihydrolipoyl dehydrogenase n=1 Tax=Faecousia sp. TaxID=2952921 RepID=UPI003A8F93AA
MADYQLIVIGAGPGGYTAALRAAKLGLHTAVIEDRECGGTCLNRGCVPTKALLHASQVWSDAHHCAGVCADGASLDLPALYRHKDEISQTLSSGIEGLFRSAKVTLLRGRARITAPGCVEITGQDAGTVTAEHILIATGSVPARPPIPGLELAMTSDELLQGTDRLYRSIVIMGGGVIGVEFATFYSDLGCEVTVIEGLDRLLPGMDRELGQNLAQLLKKQGVRVFANSMVQRVEQGEDGLTVHFTTRGKEDFVTGEAVLSAFGRSPNWKGLFADGLQPETDGRRIHTDENGQTSIPGIYAIGDVSSPVQLAHVAAAQGTACVERLAGRTPSVRLDLVPGCVYCRPEIASVGLTEADAKARDIPVKVGKCTLFANARTMIAGTGRSFMKVVAHAQTGVLLGAQLMCEHATDMIGQLSQAIANGMTARQLLAAMRPHPTFEEALGEALEELVAKLPE